MLVFFIAVACAAGATIWTFSSYKKQSSSYPSYESSLKLLFAQLKEANDSHLSGILDSSSYINLINEKKPEIKNIISLLEEPVSSKAADNERKRLLRRAYLVLNYGLSGYHCARAMLYSPAGPADNMCFPYNARDIEKDIEALDEGGGGAGASASSLMPIKEQAGAFLSTLKKKDVKPSIILIVIDTLRADMLYDKDYAPFMNKLAKEGAHFTDALAAGPATNISTASILTGAPPYAHGLLNFGKWNNGLIFASLLEEAGYETAGFSANSIIVDTMGFDYGFDYFNDRFWMPAELMNNEIFSYLDTVREGNAPLFMYMHFIDPHGPYFSPDVFNETSGFKPEFPESMQPDRIRKNITLKGLDARNYVTDKALSDMKNYYEWEIEYSDRMLVRLFDKLDKEGILDHALVIITSDHGEEFLEHGGVKHSRTLYRELLHTPLIVWGNIPEEWREAHSADRPVSLIDIAPTILEYAGLKRPGYMTGTHLFVGAPGKRRYAVAVGDEPGTISKSCTIESVVSEDYKLVLCPENQTYQLFDVHADPGDFEPVEGDGDVAEGFAKELADWRRTTTPAKSAAAGKASPEMMKQLKSLGYLE